MEWCVNIGHEDIGYMSGKGCVFVLRMLQCEQSLLSHALGPRTVLQ